MYPVIPVGPLSLPTAPFIALLAIWLGLGALARTGREVELDPDQLWNFGFLTVGMGFIVARLWHVVQFWAIYRLEWTLIFSPRPGALALWPGLLAAILAGYAYLIWKKLDPVRVGSALAVCLLVAGGVLEVGAFLTSSTVGIPSDLPWALPVFGVTRHPVALYHTVGMFGLAGLLFWRGNFKRPGRIVGWALLGYALIRLLADGFLDNTATIGEIRIVQLIAFAVALGSVLVLSGTAYDDSTLSG